MSLTQTILDAGRGATEAIRGVATAAGNYTNRIQSLLGTKEASASKIRDLYTNGFISQNSIFNPNFFVRAFDEPTYLTFRIEFLRGIETATRNTAYNNNGAMGTIQSTLYSTMFDYMPEPFLEDVELVKENDTSTGMKYSSEAYLDINLGDHGRAALLHNFKAALKDIEENFPFYFKSVSGLESLTNVDPKHGMRLKDAEITIDCLEGLDLKITQLINMYRKIVWDDTYQRWILPDMMRYFGMRIYISEIRMFHDMEKKTTWDKLNINLFGNPSSSTYDFSDPDVRNATHLPIQKKNLWNTATTAVATGTAVSNAFLGAQSYITKAVNKVSEVMGTANDIVSGANNIFNDLVLCNNAINDVMPTICLECHMCEFDISNTLGYMGQLYNNTHESKAVSPTIKIKIGQVKEKQAYPLNKYLQQKDGAYAKLINQDYQTLPTLQGLEVNSFEAVNLLRNNGMGYQGQYVSDEALNQRYTTPSLKDRIWDYNKNLGHSMGDAKAQLITRRRHGEKINDELEKMNYSKEGSTQIAATVSLAAAGLNDAASLTKSSGNTMQNLGDILKDAADKIYNGAELKSLALTDQKRAQIADYMFDAYVDGMINSTATMSPELKNILKAYKSIKNESETLSTATSKKEIKNFNIING